MNARDTIINEIHGFEDENFSYLESEITTAEVEEVADLLIKEWGATNLTGAAIRHALALIRSNEEEAI